MEGRGELEQRQNLNTKNERGKGRREKYENREEEEVQEKEEVTLFHCHSTLKAIRITCKFRPQLHYLVPAATCCYGHGMPVSPAVSKGLCNSA